MASRRHGQEKLRNRTTLGRRIAAVLGLLAILLSGFGPAPAIAKPLDAERAAVIALFGSNAMCAPADDSGPQPLAHLHHCVLCAAARIEAPPQQAAPVAFAIARQDGPVWTDEATSALLGTIASRPHKPRDPPAIG